MQKTGNNRLAGLIAGLACFAVLASGAAIAAQPLDFASARDKARRHVDRNHCPAPCVSVSVRACQRLSAASIRCKGTSRYILSSGGQRACKGKVKVTKTNSGKKAKSIGWDCRND